MVASKDQGLLVQCCLCGLKRYMTHSYNKQSPSNSHNLLQNLKPHKERGSPEFQESKSNLPSTGCPSVRFLTAHSPPSLFTGALAAVPSPPPPQRESTVKGMNYLVSAGAVGDGSAATTPPVGNVAGARLRGQALRRALHGRNRQPTSLVLFLRGL